VIGELDEGIEKALEELKEETDAEGQEG